jgi:hypothetical protein
MNSNYEIILRNARAKAKDFENNFDVGFGGIATNAMSFVLSKAKTNSYCA